MKKIFLILAMAIICFASCQEEKMMDYALDGKVYFNEWLDKYHRADSITYSFAVQNAKVTKDTLRVNTKLMGDIADYDRFFKGEVIIDSSTAIAGRHFKLLDGVMKAGEYEAYLPIEIYRTEDIKDKEVRLVVRLSAIGELSAGNDEELTMFKLVWADKLIRPTDWPRVWGTYSDNKYLFAIDQLQETNWPVYASWIKEETAGYYTNAELYRRAAFLNGEYAKYKKANGPI